MYACVIRNKRIFEIFGKHKYARVHRQIHVVYIYIIIRIYVYILHRKKEIHDIAGAIQVINIII